MDWQRALSTQKLLAVRDWVGLGWRKRNAWERKIQRGLFKGVTTTIHILRSSKIVHLSCMISKARQMAFLWVLLLVFFFFACSLVLFSFFEVIIAFIFFAMCAFLFVFYVAGLIVVSHFFLAGYG
jgi:hypothetical protein